MNYNSTLQWILKQDDEFKYQLLGRLEADCGYYIEYNVSESKLWALNAVDQINFMKDIYASLEEKPVWITLEEINNYEKQMIGARNESN